MSDTDLRTQLLEAALKVVVQMRKSQKEYFRTRNKQALLDSKRLELSVDHRLVALGIQEV